MSARCSRSCARTWASTPTRSPRTTGPATPSGSAPSAPAGNRPAGGPEPESDRDDPFGAKKVTMNNGTHPEVAALLARANRLGSDPANTNYAGGNASAKGEVTDPVTQRPVELMWVKGSGGD